MSILVMNLKSSPDMCGDAPTPDDAIDTFERSGWLGRYVAACSAATLVASAEAPWYKARLSSSFKSKGLRHVASLPGYG